MKLLKIFTLSLVCLLIAAVATVLLLDFGRFKDDIAKLASEALGKEVKLSGPVHISFGREISIEVNNASLAAPAWAQDATLVSVEQFKARAQLADLISPPYLIQEVWLKGVNSVLIDDETHGPNWVFESTVDEEAAETTSSERPSIPVAIGRIELTDINTEYRSYNTERPMSLHIASGGQLFEGAEINTYFNGSFNATPFDLRLSAGPSALLAELKEAIFAVEGTLGEVTLSGHAHFEDLLDPHRPTFDIAIRGPSVEYFTDILALPEISKGPLNLNVEVAPVGDRMKVIADGKFGEFVVQSDGTFDSLRKLEYGDINFTTSGPDIRKLANLVDQGDIPSGPFAVTAFMKREGNQLEIKDSRLTMRGIQLDVAGQIPDLNQAAYMDVTANFNVTEVEPYRRWLKIPGAIDGDINGELAIHRGTSGSKIAGQINSSLGVVTLDGNVVPTENFVGSDISLKIEAPSTVPLQKFLAFTLPTDQPLSLVGDFKLLKDNIEVNNGQIQFGADKMAFDGRVHIVEPKTKSEIQLELISDNLQHSIANLVDRIPRIPAKPAKLAVKVNHADNHFQLQEVKLDLASASIVGDVRLTEDLNSVGFKLQIDAPDLMIFADPELKAELHAQLASTESSASEAKKDLTLPLKAQASANWKNGTLEIKQFHVSAPDLEFTTAGVLKTDNGFAGSKLTFDLDIDDLSRLSALAGQQLPKQELNFLATASGDKTHLNFKELVLTTGESRITGDLSVAAGEKPHLEVALTSPHLDLKPFLPELPKEDEKKATEKPKKDPSKPAQKKSDERLIPDTPIDIAFLNTFTAKANIKIDHLSLRKRNANDVTIIGTVEDGGVRINEFSLTDERAGTLSVNGAVRPYNDTHRVSLRFKGNDINAGFPATTLAQIRALPKYVLQGEIIAHGDTPHQMASDANGFIRIEGGTGLMPSNGVNFLTNDFINELLTALNLFKDKSTDMQIVCSAATAMIEKGKLVGEPIFVLSSKRLNIVAKTKIDLSTEKLSATFNTTPQEGIGISLGNLVNPFVGVSGTLANPSLSLNPTGTLIEGGAAVATGGLSIVAKGLFDRFIGSQNACGNALSEFDKKLVAKGIEVVSAKPSASVTTESTTAQ